MAVTLGGTGSTTWTETFSYTGYTGNISEGNTGFTTYVGTLTENYNYEVESAKIILNTGAASVTSVSGKTVKYKVTSGTSNSKVLFSAEVTFKIAASTSSITDIVRKNPNTGAETSINYVLRKSTGTYFWTRPTTVALQLPWTAIKTWTLSRTAALNPGVDSPATIETNSTLATSGTTSYNISNVYCGDTLKLEYTLKPGYKSIGIDNASTYTVDPGVAISTTTSTSSGEMPKPTIKITSPVGWDAAWDDVKNNGNCNDVYVKVTVPTGMEHLAFNVSAHLYDAECYYRKDLKWTTYKDTGAEVYTNGTKISSSSKKYTTLGTIAAYGSPATFTLQVKQNDDSDEDAVSWPKYVALYIMIKPVAEGVHGYTTNYSIEYETGGTFETGGAGGGSGGYTGGFTGGYGGWMPS